MNGIDNPAEILDLVDANDKPIGSIKRSEIPRLEEDKRGFVRAMLVFLENAEGKLWIPIRAHSKKVAPGGLDASAGEHVAAGETYKEAAIRGLQEETNIKADAAKLKYAGTIAPFKGIPYFHKIYLYPFTATPRYNKDDYEAYEWLTPRQIIVKLTTGAKAKEILLPAIKLLDKEGGQV